MALVYGNAASLVSASSQYFSRAIISTATDNFTISAWVKLATTGVNHAIYQNGSNNANGYVFMINGSNKVYVDLSFVANLQGSTVLSSGTWYHVALRRQSGTWKLFLNGVQDGGTITNSPNGPNNNTTVGASRTSGGTASSFFNGLLDDVRFYERALSDSEITDLYNLASNPSLTVSSANLVGHWKMDESSGNPADSSGNGLTLTNNNSATYTTGIVATALLPDAGSLTLLGIG